MIRFTRHGVWEMVIGTVLLVAVGLGLGYLHWALGLLVLPVLIWLFAFFRDPQRAIPDGDGIMVSPADGKVSDITPIAHDELLGVEAVRVGIFLSVFNVHVNRAPCSGRVQRVIYKKGKFLNALNHSGASEENESNTILIVDPESGRPIAVVRQIVGLIARRIICTAQEGQTLERGQRIGMIKFGSRTELTIPAWMAPQVAVKVGQMVQGGMDVIARISTEAKADALAGERAT